MKRLWDSWSIETIEFICVVSGLILFGLVAFFLLDLNELIGLAFIAAVLIAFFIMSLCAWLRHVDAKQDRERKLREEVDSYEKT